jgi:dTMP kinase
MKARLVTIEGGEGAGKSTVMAALTQLFEQRGLRWLQTREPGGTPAGEAMRQVLLNPALGALCAESELLLMFASRAQLVREVIQPALASGTWVLCDRFTDASFAYQGGGRDIDVGIIAELERWAAGMRPDLSLLLDLPVDTGLARVRLRGEPSDRIEREAQTFFERVRAAYRQRAASEPQRWRVIDASEDQSNVAAAARSALESWMDSLP